MPELFETTRLKNLTTRNRFVRSATWEGLATDAGENTRRLSKLMADLAEGQVGLIISGHAYVSREGQAGPWQLGAYADTLVSGLSEMSRSVHNAGGAILLQLAHAGNQAAVNLSGLPAIGPSSFAPPDGTACLEMTPDDIERVIRAFADAAARAKEAGFDGVQIHAAHGYLLSQFLSPYFNKRTDRYGGGIENRARLLLEVCAAIMDAVGAGFPVLVKMNSEDFLDPGLTRSEMLEVAASLKQAGVDAVELSGGSGFSGRYHPIRKGAPKTQEEEAYYLESARAFKKRIDLPLALVGGIRSFEVAERLVKEEGVDYVSLCRPLIRETDLVKRWMEGDRRASTCRSDNLCFKPIRAGEGLYCLTERKEKTAAERPQ